MAAYLYFEFEGTYTFPSPDGWTLLTSLSLGTGGSGILNNWTVGQLLAATNFNFDTATIEDLGGGVFRYRATYNVAEGYNLSDISQGYPAILGTFTTNAPTLPIRLFDSSVTPPTDLTICDECRNITLQSCADSYKIVAGLTPATNYFVTIQDRNNDLYIQEITSDGNGDVTIDATSPEFPAGFWLTESGNKMIRIYADAYFDPVEDITVNDTVYSCVLLNLQYYYTTTT
jgi:hypothetical protein